ncbi:MAG: flagellar hook-basal body protein [Eubacterium sp.]|jgi:flagellar basal-body rod protein FlgF|nr:flagellar hook-basal body protein [Eubacterium sp.]
MVKGLYTAYTGMVEEQRRMDVMTNNLANASTTGYKKEGTVNQSFDDQLAVKIKDTSEIMYAKRLGDVNLGVKVGETYRDYTQGSFYVTDNTYDVALDGNGFFAVEFRSKNGQTSVKYTRDGNFTVDRNGYLMTKDGDYVLNANGARNGAGGQANYVRVDPNQDVRIEADGTIFQDNVQVGQIGVVDFADYNYLEKYGENLYDMVQGGQRIDSNARVEQGCLEMSNVNIVSEMVSMITITRAYEANQKIITTIDGSLDKAVNTVGQV